MKKSILKAASLTVALTLIATASVITATVKDIPTQEINARPATVEAVKEEVKEDVRENTILGAIEEKVKEEAARVAEVKETTEAKAEPEVKTANKAPVARLAVKSNTEEAPASEAAPIPVKVVKETEPSVEKTEIPVNNKEDDIPVVQSEEELAAVWNISATASDNVVMEFYAENPSDVNTKTGYVIISGEGAMEEAVYRHFMTIEKYLSTVKAAFEEYYGEEVDLVYDEGIDDIFELDATIEFYSHKTGEELYITEEICQALTPDAFLGYSPKAIIIEEGITNVSDNAFVFCTDVETVILPSTVKTIGISAFEYCYSLESIVIPENAKIKAGAFAYCRSLKAIQLVSDNYYLNGGIAVCADGENTDVRDLSDNEISALVNYWG